VSLGAKGQPKRGGRAKGTPNKATLELKQFREKLFAYPGYQQNVIARIMSGEANHIEKYIWEVTFGKPKEQHEHTGALTISWQM
jgi:hypothetical protein